MSRRSCRAITLLVLGCLMLGLAPAAQARTDRRSASAGLLTLDWGDIDATSGAWRADYLVLQPWEGGRIAALKARNPRLKVLMYKDVAAVVRDPHESGLFATGLSYAEAAARGWLLTDEAGRVLEWSDWPGLFPADVGDPAYQDRWADRVLDELGAHAWDGVMMDDTLTYLSHDTVGGRASTQIPTDQAMYDATESFLTRVAGRIRARGLLAVPNLTVEWDTWRSTLADWTPLVSGWENEYFVKWGLDRAGERFVGADWEWKMRMARWLAVRRVPLLAVTYSNRGDMAAQTYHRATWLLTWNGRTGSSIFVPVEADSDHWVPRATIDVGRPTGPASRGADGVWRRPYTRGRVLVNPTDVTVGASTRRAGKVRQVRLAPRSAVILRRR
jgi:hypothetical protein